MARPQRLGSLRACSRVIRAHWVRRVSDEGGEARITRSPALVGLDGWGDLFEVIIFLTGVVIFLDELGAPGRLIVRSGWILGVCLREVWLREPIGFALDFGAIFSPKVASGRQCASRKNAW